MTDGHSTETEVVFFDPMRKDQARVLVKPGQDSIVIFGLHDQGDHLEIQLPAGMVEGLVYEIRSRRGVITRKWTTEWRDPGSTGEQSLELDLTGVGSLTLVSDGEGFVTLEGIGPVIQELADALDRNLGATQD